MNQMCRVYGWQVHTVKINGVHSILVRCIGRYMLYVQSTYVQSTKYYTYKVTQVYMLSHSVVDRQFFCEPSAFCAWKIGPKTP